MGETDAVVEVVEVEVVVEEEEEVEGVERGEEIVDMVPGADRRVVEVLMSSRRDRRDSGIARRSSGPMTGDHDRGR